MTGADLSAVSSLVTAVPATVIENKSPSSPSGMQFNSKKNLICQLVIPELFVNHNYSNSTCDCKMDGTMCSISIILLFRLNIFLAELKCMSVELLPSVPIPPPPRFLPAAAAVVGQIVLGRDRGHRGRSVLAGDLHF